MSLASFSPLNDRVIRVPIKPRFRARVLILAPNGSRAHRWRALLLRGRFQTLVAEAGAALDRMVGSSADVILLDCEGAPGRGSAICHELRALGVALPIVIVDPEGSVEDLLDGFEAGTDAYLLGAVDHRDLFNRIEALAWGPSDREPDRLRRRPHGASPATQPRPA
jgi:DNA-binding response OmpR family regulator